jgi:UDP-N-acetylmuramoyl-tripeptide--D-alanyl-D-alanine ligase
MGHLAAAVVAEARARQGGLRLLAVTGSNGKTTSKELLALIVGLLSGRPPLATRGNLNNHLGVPLTVARLAAADRFAVIEMGASQPGDIATLAGWVAPDVGLITNIGYAHTEGLGGLDGVRLVKSGIREGGRCHHLCIPEAEVALPWWSERAAAVGAALHAFGSGEGAESRFTRAQLDGPVTLTLDGRSFTLPLPLPGLHNAANLAGALHAAWLLTGQHPADHAEALATAIGALVLPGGRLRRVVAGGRQIVDDAYNANPSSVVASLTLLAAEPANRVAVLGDMMELGADEEAQHRTVGRLAAEAADCVVAVGRRAAWIADGAAGAPRVVHHATNEAAAGWLAREIPAGSVVWVKGSRSMKMEEIVSRLEAAWGVP